MDKQLVEKVAEKLYELDGYSGWEESGDKYDYLEYANRLITDLNLVQLDEDQSLPTNPYEEFIPVGFALSSRAWKSAIIDMLNAGFKKVKECGN